MSSESLRLAGSGHRAGGRQAPATCGLVLLAAIVAAWPAPAPAQESIPDAVRRVDQSLREVDRGLRDMERALGDLDRRLQGMDRRLQDMDERTRALERQVQELQRAGASGVAGPAQPGREDTRPGRRIQDCPECPELVVVPAGSFRMGSPSGEEGRLNREGPVHRVRIAEPFAAGVYEVTFAEWDACRRGGGCTHDPDDRGWGRGTRPVINVSWNDARQYVRWLAGRTGKGYRLLSESEWEYVARAGTRTPFHTGKTISTDRANYDGRYAYGSGRKGQYRKRTTTVGSFSPNGFGLHDVHGNVWEWVEDCWHGRYGGAPSDGRAWTSAGAGNCSYRVVRGGSWVDNPRGLRSAIRRRYVTASRVAFAGFRVARALD